MLQSNQPFNRVGEETPWQKFGTGAINGTVAAGIMDAGLYGASKIKSTNPRLQSLQKLGKEAHAHGYGSMKRRAFTYGSSALIDGVIDSAIR
ncbi:hypothetical protein C2I27_03970 [Priestia megaterium]|uniref:hypothetical protein n=1 Tax=Priestia megaterium TaxID=1404 RepID=UPI000D509271|nr:hypothetical protein [Priestia megaterium]PVC75052.1 hypothetical protein C2I27_03970 [Priestia megaterium]